MNTSRHLGLVTVDVEPDNVWTNIYSRELRNIPGLRRFQQVCDDFGVQPTYLVTYSVLADRESWKILEELHRTGNCEIGMHPHLWETPPMLPMDHDGTAHTALDYPTAAFEAKIGRFADALSSRVGTISSHRAGRWGFIRAHARLLADKGIIVDSSITPGVDWRDTGGPDHRRESSLPSMLYSGDAFRCPLFEVPCTIRQTVASKLIRGSKTIQRIASKLGMARDWLRCMPNSSLRELLGVCRWALARLPLQNIATHSSELAAAASPYWKSEDSIERHFELYRGIFAWWSNHGVQGTTLRDAANLLEIDLRRSK